jgi:serine protease Do
MADTKILKLRWAPFVAAALVGCLFGVVMTALALGPGEAGLAAPAYARGVAPESQDAIISSIRKVGPAVVNINVMLRPPEQPALPPAFRQFFEEPFPRQGQASGVIIDAQGHVLTNNHVVQDARLVQVTLADGRTFKASTVGTDPLSDIAVVRIAEDKLPVAELGTSADKPIGSWVIAIGNPFGYENTATVGVLSARDRNLRASTGVTLDHLLQTDAAINPGNSGGALVDLEGKVIGIPTAIIGYAQGIGFAISAENARKAAEQLIATGRVSHPWLGIAYAPVTAQVQQEMKLASAKGVVVVQVVPGSPADQAGVKPRDVIVRVGKREVTEADTLLEAVRAVKVGEKLPLTIIRDGREMDISVTIGERPAPEQAAAASPARPGVSALPAC